MEQQISVFGGRIQCFKGRVREKLSGCNRGRDRNLISGRLQERQVRRQREIGKSAYSESSDKGLGKVEGNKIRECRKLAGESLKHFPT